MKQFRILKRLVVIAFYLFLVFSAGTIRAQFVKGADIGWLQQMEATGYIFYDSAGVQTNCMQILKDKGINTVRLRVWVNPSSDRTNGHCSKKEVAAMALRAKNMGMRIMIDFHYSDSWADPGKQNKPAAWASDSFSQLLTDLYNHTYSVLDTLKSIGATPDWAQIGNEITGGMLWPDGSTANWGQLAQLLNKGYDATKAVDSTIKVVIHLDQGNDNTRFRTFFDNATNYGVRYDVIGASYYPYWLGTDYTLTINDLGNNLSDMVTRYGKEVIVAEVGGDYTKVQNTYDMLIAVQNKVKAVQNNKGLGVIYWEPEGEKSWSGYQLSCWGADGKPTAALNAFLLNLTGINSIKKDQRIRIYPNPLFGSLLNVELSGITGLSVLRIFDMTGKLMKEQTLNNQTLAVLDVRLRPGIYLISVNNAGQEMIESPQTLLISGF
jgi:arabinogalactan endo-1,4-beta-galactosidase